MQKKVGAYLLKQALSPSTSQQTANPPSDPRDLDGRVFTDDQGQPLGTTQRVHDVVVYVVAGEGEDVQRAVERALREPDSRTFVHTVDGQLAGLIYVPTSAGTPAAPRPPMPRPPARAEAPASRSAAVRADDV